MPPYDQVMANYMSGPVRERKGLDATDERVTLEEFLAEVKKTYDVSKKVPRRTLTLVHGSTCSLAVLARPY